MQRAIDRLRVCSRRLADQRAAARATEAERDDLVTECADEGDAPADIAAAALVTVPRILQILAGC